jgi:hypothetical protein
VLLVGIVHDVGEAHARQIGHQLADEAGLDPENLLQHRVDLGLAWSHRTQLVR